MSDHTRLNRKSTNADSTGFTPPIQGTSSLASTPADSFSLQPAIAPSQSAPEIALSPQPETDAQVQESFDSQSNLPDLPGHDFSKIALTWGGGQTASQGEEPPDVGRNDRPIQRKSALSHRHSFIGHDFSRVGVTLQAKLTVSQPDDPYEQEADRVADQVMRMPEAGNRESAKPKFSGHDFGKIAIQSQQQSHHSTLSASQPAIQRQCAACEAEEEELNRSIQRTASTSKSVTEPDIEPRIQAASGGGSGLEQQAQTHLEQSLGADLSSVRVHTDGEADRLAQSVNAVAFTTGQDIFFSAGSYNPSSSTGMHLLAHEVVHTIQQSSGAVSATPTNAGVSISDPNDHFEQEAEQVADQVMRLPADAPSSEVGEHPSTVQNTSAPPTVQRLPSWEDVKGTVSAGANWVGDTASAGAEWVGDRVGDVASMGADAFASIVSRVAPGLADLIRNGPIGLLTNTMKDGIQSWVSGITGNLNVMGAIGNLKSNLTGIFETIQGVVKGDPASCEAFSQSLDALREMGESFLDNPVIQQLQEAFGQVSGVFTQVSSLVIAPVFDTLMEVAGGVFNQVRSIASTIWGWAGKVRDFLGAAWDWVKEQLGIGGDGEEGIWDWLKSKASEVWSQIKETMGPVIEPIKKVATVLLAFSPVGLFVIITRYVPQLVEAVKWLWAHKDDPDIVRSAHEQMGNTILPQLLSGVQGFSEGVQNAARSFVDHLTQISESVLSLLGAITGVPLLNMAHNLVQTVSDGIQSLVTWGQETFQKAATFVQEIAEKVRARVQPYIGVLTSIGLAIVNPGMIPMILMGWAWQMLPNCFKAPIINFLLDTVIAILESVPSLPMFGPLWPLLKSGVLGFLQGIRNQDDDTKVAITNKIAKIISGASPAFLFGFVKGFLRGVWEGLTDPFVLIYSIIQGFTNLVTWLNGVANQALAPDSETSATAATQTAATQSLSTSTTDAAAEEPAATEETSQAPIANSGEVSQRMQAMAGELQPPIEEVTGGFMPAVQEFFSGGEGMSFEQLMQKFGEAWSAIESAIQGAAGRLANQVCEFFMQDSAEGTLGDSVGWLAGTIVFEVVLGILTAGTSTAWLAAKGPLKFFVKLLTWTDKAMGAAFKALSKLGGFVLDGIKGLGKLLSNAGGAVRAIMDALGEIGQRLVAFGDELLGLARRGPADEVAGEAAERGARETAEEAAERSAREGVEESAEREARETVEEGAEQSAGEVGEETGELAGRQVTKTEILLETPFRVGDADHSIKVLQRGDRVELIMCSVCGKWSNSIDRILKDIPNTEQSRNLRRRFEDLQAKIQGLEEQLNRRAFSQSQATHQINNITNDLNRILENYGITTNLKNFERVREQVAEFVELSLRARVDAPVPAEITMELMEDLYGGSASRKSLKQFVGALQNGMAARARGAAGIKILDGEVRGFTHELKILGAGERLLGKEINGRIIFSELSEHL